MVAMESVSARLYRLSGRSHHRIGAGDRTDRAPVDGAVQGDAAEAGVAPDLYDAGVGNDVEMHRPQKMHGLIDGAHRTVAVPGRRAGDAHGRVGESPHSHAT